jgi:DNA polymerase I
LLDYCASDVYALRRLLPAMEPYLDFPRAFLRGRYMRAVARMMQTGVPVDGDLLAYLRQRWEAIKANLTAAVDGACGVYDGSSFRAARWLDWCQTHGVPWPQLPSGAPKLDRETFQTMADDFPEVRPIGELRAAMAQMKATNVIAGPDGRNRAWLAPFGTKTSRNAPPSSEFLFGASSWLRHVVQAPPGAGVAYLDWEQQEIGIAAVLSGDPALTAAYISGDPSPRHEGEPWQAAGAV